TQIKGDGETHPLLAPNDEFAAFERWDKGNLDLSELKKPEMLEFEYARSAVEEDNFFGKTSSSEPSPSRAMHPFIKTEKATIMGWEQTSSGYAAVWATENTRESLWDAMQRRETYATTGPRMVVRFFGGFDFEKKDVGNRMPAQVGYTKGVPMGGDLST